jgi:hypothetical protein
MGGHPGLVYRQLEVLFIHLGSIRVPVFVASTFVKIQVLPSEFTLNLE